MSKPVSSYNDEWSRVLRKISHAISVPEEAGPLVRLGLESGAFCAADSHGFFIALLRYRLACFQGNAGERANWGPQVVEKYPLMRQAFDTFVREERFRTAPALDPHPAPSRNAAVSPVAFSVRAEDVALEKIRTDDARLQAVDEQVVHQLRASFLYYRMLHPVILSADYRLIAGYNRFAACQLLGWKTIRAEIFDLDDARLEQIGIVENLDRRRFSGAETTQLVARRKLFLEVVHPETLQRSFKSKVRPRGTALAFATPVSEGATLAAADGAQPLDAAGPAVPAMRAVVLLSGRLREAAAELSSLADGDARGFPEERMRRIEALLTLPYDSDESEACA